MKHSSVCPFHGKTKSRCKGGGLIHQPAVFQNSSFLDGRTEGDESRRRATVRMMAVGGVAEAVIRGIEAPDHRPVPASTEGGIAVGLQHEGEIPGQVLFFPDLFWYKPD